MGFGRGGKGGRGGGWEGGGEEDGAEFGGVGAAAVEEDKGLFVGEMEWGDDDGGREGGLGFGHGCGAVVVVMLKVGTGGYLPLRGSALWTVDTAEGLSLGRCLHCAEHAQGPPSTSMAARWGDSVAEVPTVRCMYQDFPKQAPYFCTLTEMLLSDNSAHQVTTRTSSSDVGPCSWTPACTCI